MMSKATKLKAVGLIVVCISATALAINSGSETKKIPVSFNEVWSAVTVAPDVRSVTKDVQQDILSYGSPENPILPEKSNLVETGLAMASGKLKKAAIRTVEASDDYRSHFKKLVHAAGTCFSGSWEITEDSPYSGLFKQGSSALLIGRISTADPNTVYPGTRAFGFAVKLFPTTNPDLSVPTANFFTVHHLNGTEDQFVTDVAFTNEPPVDDSFFRNGKVNPVFFVNQIFKKADIHPGVRPLYTVSRSGLEAGVKPVTPKWIRIRLAQGLKNPAAQDADFRAELSPKNYPDGLIYTIEVSDTTKDPAAITGWRKIGQIRTSPMVVSFGCDHRLHFPHHKFNDPNE